VLTMARWHEDDLTGRIANAASSESDAWRFIQMPALAQAPKGADDDWRDDLDRADGEALWPEKWPADMLTRIKHSIDASDWQALYQQDPTPPEGHLFKVGDWMVAPPPDRSGLRLVRFWDTAASVRSGDYTVGALVGMDGNNRTFVLDLQRFQGGPAEVEQRILSAASIDGLGVPIRWEQERAGAGKTVSSTYVRMLVGYDAAGILADGKKETRARPLASQVQNHNVFLADASWVKTFIDEARTFPTGRHDDQVDAVVGGFTFLAEGGFTALINQDDAETVAGVTFDALLAAHAGSNPFISNAGVF
jgi:predicted phage terminase large subunit-like protein